jgi:hypothetical protein
MSNAGGRSQDSEALQRALVELQATAYNFAAACIQESRVRAQYIRDIQAMGREFQDAVRTGRLTPQAAAAEANLLRNQILELSRLRSSPTGKAFAARLKRSGRTMAELTEKYGQNLFKQSFSSLSETQQAAVYAEIVASAGRGDERVIALAQKLGRIGKRVLLISLAVASYEIYAAEDKPREVAPRRFVWKQGQESLLVEPGGQVGKARQRLVHLSTGPA